MTGCGRRLQGEEAHANSDGSWLCSIHQTSNWFCKRTATLAILPSDGITLASSETTAGQGDVRFFDSNSPTATDTAVDGHFTAITMAEDASSEESTGTLVVDRISIDSGQSVSLSSGSSLAEIDIASDKTVVVSADTNSPYFWKGTDWQPSDNVTTIALGSGIPSSEQGDNETQVARSTTDVSDGATSTFHDVGVNAAATTPSADNVALSLTVSAGATVAITGASAAAVTFTGATGTLKLDDALAFTGEVSGLAGSDAI